MNLELCFAYQSGDGQAALDVALEWRELLKCELTIFSDVDCSIEFRGILPDDVKVQNLHLSERVNQFDKHTTGLKSWSPWGTKSGPNYQFFRILQYYEGRAEGTWLLYLESDTYSATANPSSHIRSLVSQHQSAWVIGAVPSEISLPYIDELLFDHINGACLLNVGSNSFHEFLTSTWGPAVLWKIRAHPYYAYDCITATLEWNGLPEPFLERWRVEAHKFVRTQTMLNVSNLTLPLRKVQQLLNSEDSSQVSLQKIWFVHAKIKEYLAISDPSRRSAMRQAIQAR